MSSPCGPYGNCTYAPLLPGSQPRYGDYHCNCLPGYTGDHCEKTIADPCQNNGCVNGECEPINVIASGNTTGSEQSDDMYVCLCDPLFTGRFCDVPLEDDCADSEEKSKSKEDSKEKSKSGSKSKEKSGSQEEVSLLVLRGSLSIV